MPRPMTFLNAHAPNGLLAPGGLLGTSHRFLLYVPLESGRNVFAQPPLPRTAMEQSGHAQVPTLLVALVRRQAGRAGWRAEITYENKEE